MAIPIVVSEVGNYEGQEVLIQGWLYNIRSSGKLRFLQIRDGSGIIQGVMLKGEVNPNVFRLSDSLTQESSIKVTGSIRADQRSPIGYEIGIINLEVIQVAEPYPISHKEHGTAFLMDHRHLWIRSSRQHMILQIRSEIIKACRDYFDERGYILVDAPIISPSSCEGTTTLFETNYFGEKAYLTQSGQLYMEAAAMALGKVYCFGPTFRAEKSKTRRHLTEFWMIEPEVAYLDLIGAIDLAEDFVLYIVEKILEKRWKELQSLGRSLTSLEKIKKPLSRISYTEAIELLKQEGKNHIWGDDFGAEEETILANAFNRPVIVHRYPTSCKPFYMKQDPKNSLLSLCMDMLAPEGYGEIIGGGQREHNLETLKRNINMHGLDEKVFQWYLDLRRYGSVPHSGFGLGIERMVAWICGLSHVRETIPFPRLLQRLYP